MKRSRTDSRLLVWGENYINNPQIRLPEDRSAQIEQIENLDARSYIVEVFNTRQTVQPPVKRGKWIEDDGIYAKCSVCGETVYQRKNWRFCPSCGTRMEKEE